MSLRRKMRKLFPSDLLIEVKAICVTDSYVRVYIGVNTESTGLSKSHKIKKDAIYRVGDESDYFCADVKGRILYWTYPPRDYDC